jgi:hypothetical protein
VRNVSFFWTVICVLSCVRCFSISNSSNYCELSRNCALSSKWASTCCVLLFCTTRRCASSFCCLCHSRRYAARRLSSESKSNAESAESAVTSVCEPVSAICPTQTSSVCVALSVIVRWLK